MDIEKLDSVAIVSSPLVENSDGRKSDKHAENKKSKIVAALGNFNIQYNFGCLTIVENIMKSHSDDPNGLPDYPEESWVGYTLKGLVFAGAVLGMLIMGYVGDMIGRRVAMIATFSLVVLGALGSAIFSFSSDPNAVYIVIGVCRFVLGVGVGGIYPLSAAAAAESNSINDDDDSKNKKADDGAVGWAFFWQAPGTMAPYVVAWILLAIPAFDGVTSLQFRLILGLGAILSAAPLYDMLRNPPKPGTISQKRPHEKSYFEVLSQNSRHVGTLIGTAGTWFLFDVSYYGTLIFTTSILKSIFGGDSSLSTLCWQSLIVSGMGVPACICFIFVLKRWGGRFLSNATFALSAACFVALASVYSASETEYAPLKFVLFCMTIFALWGPNVSTYVLPASCFPSKVRTTFHGFSASGGKIGAVVGTFIYTPIQNSSGLAAVMWFQAALMVIGFAVSYFFIPTPQKLQELEDQGREDERSDKVSLL